MNKEWMPENPCLTCTNTGDLQDKNYCKNHCSLIVPYTSAINYQRKLLEHLLNPDTGWTEVANYFYSISSVNILKDLEANNGTIIE
jgi:hypothetical protein